MPETLRNLRRGQIVSAGRRIVAERGLEALTIGALESRVNFTRGVITYHFADKNDILAAVLDSAVAEIDAAMLAGLKESRTLPERVRAVLAGQVRGWLEHPEAGRIILAFWGKLSADRRLAKKNARLYARYREQSARIVEGTDADPATVAALLVATVIGLVCQAYFDPDAVNIEAAVDEAVRLFVTRLAPQKK